MYKRVSGGGLPSNFNDSLAKSLCNGIRTRLHRPKFTHLFQSGCEATPASIPIPMPKNDKPVDCSLNPWLVSKMIGNAWNAKYSIPSSNEVHIFRRSAILSKNTNSGG